MCDPTELPIPLTYKQLLAALKAWHDPTPNALLDQLLLVQEAREEAPTDGSLPTQRLATNQVLLGALDWLQQDDPPAHTILRQHYLDRVLMKHIAHERNIDIDTANRHQREAIKRLLAIVLRREEQLRRDRVRAQEASLPQATPEDLFGVAAVRAAVRDALLRPAAPWLVAICGLGGIGKTVLADVVVRDVMCAFHFRRVLWVEVQAASMSGAAPSGESVMEQIVGDLCRQLMDDPYAAAHPAQLRYVHQRLRQQPSLVVIDNLEEPHQVDYLVHHLTPLTNPSRFLLTSRYPPAGARGVDVFTLDELDESSSLDLIRHVARQTKLHSLVEATPADLRPIFQATGGNPLALRLVVGLTATMPLTAALADLPQARTGPIEALYQRIYWRAWEMLTPDARRLLKSMPMASASGATIEEIEEATGLSGSSLWGAIHDLVARSLLLVRGDAWRKRYAIHRLTESFLLTEIAQWPPSTLSSLS